MHLHTPTHNPLCFITWITYIEHYKLHKEREQRGKKEGLQAVNKIQFTATSVHVNSFNETRQSKATTHLRKTQTHMYSCVLAQSLPSVALFSTATGPLPPVSSHYMYNTVTCIFVCLLLLSLSLPSSLLPSLPRSEERSVGQDGRARRAP